MLTIQDCSELSELRADEASAIGDDDVSARLAVELADYIVHTPEGEQGVKHMIADVIETARQRGDLKHAAVLRLALQRFVQARATAA